MYIKNFFLILSFMLVINIYVIYNITQQPTYTYIYSNNNKQDVIKITLDYLGCPRVNKIPVSNGVKIAEDHTGINGVLLVCLLYTESNFDTTAKSKKGYLGIAQTKPATMIYPEVDILHGAMVLKDKLRITNGDLLEALMLYKGGRNKEAKKQAKEVLILYDKVNTKHERENT